MVTRALRLHGPETVLAETYFRLAIAVSDSDKALLREYLDGHVSGLARGLFRQEPKFAVTLENGSLKGRIKVIGHAFVATMVTYGAIRDGLHYMVHDAQEFSERVVTTLKDTGIPQERFLRIERRLGTPGKILRIAHKIEDLKKHGRDMSRDDYTKLLDKLENELAQTLEQIAADEEAEIVKKGIQETIRADTPARLPFRDVPTEKREVIVPRRLQFIRGALADEGGSAKNKAKPDERYRVEFRKGKLYLRPRKG